MPKTTFPYVTGSAILRTCRQGRHQVAAPAMCRHHPRTCLTCCSSRLKRDCAVQPLAVRESRRPARMDDDVERLYDCEEAKERAAELAQIRHQLGFRPETEAEMAENIAWRTA